MKIYNRSKTEIGSAITVHQYATWYWNNLLKKASWFAAVLCILSFTSCTKDFPRFHGKIPPSVKYISNKVVIDWSNNALETFGGTSYPNPLLASRAGAMMHIAMHDALNAIVPVFETYSLQETEAAGHPVAAAASAAYEVLLSLHPEKKPFLDEKLAQSIDTIAQGTAKQKGIAIGKKAANVILALRANDGAFQEQIGPITPSNVAGVYQAVPPFNFIHAPFWKSLKPFGLTRPDQFRSAPQPALNSQQYAKDFNEVKEVGLVNSTSRTAEQALYAKFWYEFSEMGWNRIGRVASADQKLDLYSTARLMALLNIALADSYIAGWDSKDFYNFWRPHTAIVRAGIDGNDKTIADTAWQSFLPTPPVQDYPSTHSVLGRAGATVLTAFFENNTGFTTQSSTAQPAGASRTFKSFNEAADENADSRVRAGIHFRFSTVAGQQLGEKIASWTLQKLLRPKN